MHWGLIPLGISLGWLLVAELISAIADTKYLISRAQFASLTTLWRVLLAIGVTTKVALAANAATLLGLFFARRRSFPKLLALFALGFAVFSLADSYARTAANMQGLPSIASALNTRITSRLLWGGLCLAYTRASRRVAATFVR